MCCSARCSVLQCVAVCCSVCSVLQRVAACCSVAKEWLSISPKCPSPPLCVAVRVAAYLFVKWFVKWCCSDFYKWIIQRLCVVHFVLENKILQGGKDAQDASSCRSLFAKQPLIIGFFGGKWPFKIRHPMHLRHPLSLCTLNNICCNICTRKTFFDKFFFWWNLRVHVFACVLWRPHLLARVKRDSFEYTTWLFLIYSYSTSSKFSLVLFVCTLRAPFVRVFLAFSPYICTHYITLSYIFL